MPSPVAKFECPDCHVPASCAVTGRSVRLENGRRRVRTCKRCRRTFATIEENGQPERFTHWVRRRCDRPEEDRPDPLAVVDTLAWRYGGIQGALRRRGTPEKYLLALARAGRRLGLNVDELDQEADYDTSDLLLARAA